MSALWETIEGQPYERRKKPRSLNGAGLQLSLLDTHRRAGAKVSGCPGSAGAPSWRPSSGRHYCGPASPRRGGASTRAEKGATGTISGRVVLVSVHPAILRLRAPWWLPAAVEVAALALAVGWPRVLVADTFAGRICQGVEVAALAAASGGGADTIAARSAGGASTGEKKKPLQPTLLRASRGRPQRGIEKAPAGTISGAAGLVSVLLSFACGASCGLPVAVEVSAVAGVLVADTIAVLVASTAGPGL